MHFELSVAIVVVAFDSRFLDDSVHAFDLTVGPRMPDRLWCNLLGQLFSPPDQLAMFESGAMARFLGLDELFEGRRFDREIIVLCVRWYLRFKLSFRDLVEMMAKRGLSMVRTTIMRWVHHYAPEFERRWNRFAQSAGAS